MSFKVGDEFRTNKLSLKPGGSTVTVHLIDSDSKIYDKIKNPGKYVASLIKLANEKGITRIDVDGEEFWKSDGIQGNLF